MPIQLFEEEDTSLINLKLFEKEIPAPIQESPSIATSSSQPLEFSAPLINPGILPLGGGALLASQGERITRSTAKTFDSILKVGQQAAGAVTTLNDIEKRSPFKKNLAKNIRAQIPEAFSELGENLMSIGSGSVMDRVDSFYRTLKSRNRVAKELVKGIIGTTLGVGLETGLQVLNLGSSISGKIFDHDDFLQILADKAQEKKTQFQVLRDKLGPVDKFHNIASQTSLTGTFRAIRANPTLFLEDILTSSPEFATQFLAATTGKPIALALTVATQSLGDNIEESLSRGLSIDQAIVQGTMRSFGDAGLARVGTGLAAMKLFSGRLADFTARTSLQMSWEVGGESLNRYILDLPGMTPGEMVIAAGMEGIYGAPADFYTLHRQKILAGDTSRLIGNVEQGAPVRASFFGSTKAQTFINIRDNLSAKLMREKQQNAIIGDAAEAARKAGQQVPTGEPDQFRLPRTEEERDVLNKFTGETAQTQKARSADPNSDRTIVFFTREQLADIYPQFKNGLDEAKRENIRKFREKGEGFESIPFLGVVIRDNIAVVTSHDGRHRSIQLDEENPGGPIPVEIVNILGGIWGQTDTRPTHIIGIENNRKPTNIDPSNLRLEAKVTELKQNMFFGMDEPKGLVPSFFHKFPQTKDQPRLGFKDNSDIPNDFNDLAPGAFDAHGFIATGQGKTIEDARKLSDFKLEPGATVIVSRTFTEDLDHTLQMIDKIENETVFSETEKAQILNELEQSQLRHQDAINGQKDRIKEMAQLAHQIKIEFGMKDVTLRIIDLNTLPSEVANEIDFDRSDNAFFSDKDGAVIYIDSASPRIWKTKDVSTNGEAREIKVFNETNYKAAIADGFAKFLIQKTYRKLKPEQQKRLRQRWEQQLQGFANKPLIDMAQKVLPGPAFAEMIKYDSDLTLSEALVDPDEQVRDVAHWISDFSNWLRHHSARSLMHSTSNTPEVLKLFGTFVGPNAEPWISPRNSRANNYLRLNKLTLNEIGAPEPITVTRPATPSTVWERIDPADLANGKVKISDVVPLISNKKFPAHERRALEAALSLQQGEKGDIALENKRFAVNFDEALQYENAMSSWWNNLTVLSRLVQKNTTNIEPIWDPDNVEISRFKSLLFSLPQVDSVNKKNPFARNYFGQWRQRAGEQNIILARGEELLQDIKSELKGTKELGKFTQILISQTQNKKKFSFEEMNAQFSASEALFNIVNKTNDYFDSFFDQIMELELERSNPDDIDAIRTRYEDIKSRAFFPMLNFGNKVVAVRAKEDFTFEDHFYKKGDPIHIAHYEKESSQASARQRVLKTLQEQGIRDKVLVGKFTLKNQRNQQFEGMPTFLWNEVRKSLVNNTIDGLSKEDIGEIDEIVKISAIDSNAVSRSLEEANVKAFSEDPSRAIAAYANSFASWFSHAKWEPQMKETITNLGARIEAAKLVLDSDTTDFQNALENIGLDDFGFSSKTQAESKIRRLETLHKYLKDHLEYMNSQKGEWTGVRQLGFIFQLAMNPKSWTVNATQVPVVLFPYLSTIVGADQAFKHIKSATDMVFRDLRQGKNPAIPDWLGDLIHRGEQIGALNQSLAREATAMANGGKLQRFIGSGASRAVGKTMHAVTMPFQTVEGWNRRITMIAAVTAAVEKHSNLALDKNLDPIEFQKRANRLFEIGIDAIDNTMFEYSKWARPALFRGKVKSAVFLFQSFMQNMVFQMSRWDKRSAALIGMMLFVGGGLGLPFAEDVLDIGETTAEVFAKRDINVRETLQDYIESKGLPSDFLLKGAARNNFGLSAMAREIGIPVADFDLSGSLSLGRIALNIPQGIKELASKDEFNIERSLARMAETNTGPVGSMAFSWLRAATDKDLGIRDTRFWEMILPKGIPAGTMTALRWYRDSEETSRSGNPVTGGFTFDWTDPIAHTEAMGKALGFQPARLNAAREQERKLIERFFFYRNQSDYLRRVARKNWRANIEGKGLDIPMWEAQIKEIHIFNRDPNTPRAARINIKNLKEGVVRAFKIDRLRRMGAIQGDKRTFNDPVFEELRDDTDVQLKIYITDLEK